MSVKGIVTGNGPADRLLESLRGEPAEQISQEEAAKRIEWKRSIRKAMPVVLRAERMRTIASLRGRLDRAFNGYIGDPRPVVRMVLDDMERLA